MGRTTFSGPISAGPILKTVGTTIGTDVTNVGDVMMSQSGLIIENGDGATTGIVIPAHSQITNIYGYGTVLFEGDCALGTSLLATNIADAVGVTANTQRRFDPQSCAIWQDVGSTDIEIFHFSDNAGIGAGRAAIVVEYMQKRNLL